jgi:hypothetical protein
MEIFTLESSPENRAAAMGRYDAGKAAPVLGSKAEPV